MNEDRLEVIETKIAFQEKTIKDLSDIIYNQQKKIDILNETMKQVINRIKDSSLITAGGNLKDEKPPHY
jgi:SlyX protein